MIFYFRIKPNSMKAFSIKLILLFFSIEVLLRICSGLVPYWYRQVEHNIHQTQIKYIFIGSSRVASAIVPSVFLQVIGDKKYSDSAINMGAGYSTLAEHYFGLQRLAAAMPDGLKGVTVFLEAPQGVPDLETWQGNWLHPQNPYLLVNTMSFQYLRTFWDKSASNFDQKLTVTAAMLSNVIAMQGNGGTLLANIKKRLLRNRPGTASEKIDLSASGGVRTDEAGMQNARNLAVSLAADHMKHERLFTRHNGNDTVLKSLNDFITSKGGRLVLYFMPVSPIWSQRYSTAIGRENRVIANDLTNSWAIHMLSPRIEIGESDFPDYWHLRKSRSSEFTKSLALEFVKLGNHY